MTQTALRLVLLVTLPMLAVWTAGAEEYPVALSPGPVSGLLPAAACTELRWWDRGNGTVLDCNTGKVWLKDASCLGQWPWSFDYAHDGTIFTRVGDLNAGSDLECADYTSGTYDDWEVPEIGELCSAAVVGYCPQENASDSLIDTSVGPPTVSNARGDGVWTTEDAFVEVQSHRYWSSTPHPFAHPYPWSVDLYNGDVTQGISELGRLWVWPVRSPAPCSAADGETLVLRDDTIIDDPVFAVCYWITVGPNLVVMGPNGDLVLRAGSGIEIRNGVWVGVDGKLTVEIDPALLP